ncbi:MAG: acylase [Chitinophagaceae bacterium]
MRLFYFLFSLPLLSAAQTFSTEEINRFSQQAQRVTVIQDDWGIPHIYGKSDADAVFGLMYVQCEQNFLRVEENHLELFGRLSEVYGKERLYEDLQMRLIYDTSAAKKDYAKSPEWFKKLMNAYADGINYYLYKHPKVKTLALTRFEPWFALMRTNGSISSTQTGGATINDLMNLYKAEGVPTSYAKPAIPSYELDPIGSNGFALAPSKTKNRNSIIYINPHTTFFYRTEVQMVSDEGLNTYGAVTWGTFFVFQGFNEHCGWVHTTSYADVADLYREKIEKSGNNIFSVYDGKRLPIQSKQIAISYKADNELRNQNFTTYYTNHGPVMGMRNGEWLSLRENNRSLNALMQSWLRTKAKGFEDFRKVMDIRSNSSDNTVFADDKGNIAYWHGNFIPKRNKDLNYTQPLDGSTSATDWKGLHTLDEMVHVYNPKTGFIENCNSTPFTVSGDASPKKKNYPYYMAPDGQNGRAINAVRLLNAAKDVTIDKMIANIGYNRYLSAFEFLLPPLFEAYNALQTNDALKQSLQTPIHFLHVWDKNAASSSVATTLAIEWAQKLVAKIPPAQTQEAASNAVAQFESMTKTPAAEKLNALADVLKDLEKNFGTWQVAWGDMNRYQRTTDGVFDDSKPSLPVSLGPGTWGSIPSFASRRIGTKKRYGVSGNSFIAAVEFGKRLKAKTILVSGESFDPGNKHFNDQAEGYIEGKFKNIYFYKEDVLKHVERTYHPGE